MSSTPPASNASIETQILYTHISDLTKKNVQLEIEVTLKNTKNSDLLNEKINASNERISALTKDLDQSNEKINTLIKDLNLSNKKLSLLKKIIDDSNLVSGELLPHDKNIQKVNNILNEKKYDKLYQYGSFLLEKIDVEHIRLWDNALVLRHIIDNCSNLNVKLLNGKYVFLMQMLISHQTNYDIIKYIIDKKNVNLEEEYINKSTPFYFACQHSSFGIINLILDQNVRSGFINNDGETHEYYLRYNGRLNNDLRRIICDRIQSMINSRNTKNE